MRTASPNPSIPGLDDNGIPPSFGPNDRNPESSPLTNDDIAGRLEHVADLLEAQRANSYRVRAYRTAAQTLRSLAESVQELIARGGHPALQELPGIGKSLARAVERLAQTGRWGLLKQLEGETAAEEVFITVPGVGRKTAARIHEELGIETLSDLEAAAYDGRLARMTGMGRKKVQAVRDSLAGRFRHWQRATIRRSTRENTDQPSVEELLSIDEEYRRKAERDRLLRIAPRRFNPMHEAWLPILHTHREDRHYTAMYSNTARAHEWGAVRDWVVIFRDDPAGEGQWTVVNSRFGNLQGRRVVRGRESECRDFYARQQQTTEQAAELA
jgi:Holliday junction resolvasome RuvABC DNA-binding subunit